jgi:hypothetical protein
MSRFMEVFLLANCSLASAEGLITSMEVSTLGGGVHFAVPISESVNFRFGGNAANYDRKDSTEDVDYKLKFRLRTVDALLDYYPWQSRFRLVGGFMYNGSKISAEGVPDGGTYTINGHTYNASAVGKVDGQITINKFAPYLGFGLGNGSPDREGFGFEADLGVMYLGQPKAKINTQTCTASAAVCASLESDIKAETADLNEDISKYKWYPVIRLGISYRF